MTKRSEKDGPLDDIDEIDDDQNDWAPELQHYFSRTSNSSTSTLLAKRGGNVTEEKVKESDAS